MDYKELKELHKKAKKIVESDLDWDVKYRMIFSDEICRKVSFDWFDPDMDYEDDVRAWMSGFDEHMRVQKIIAQLD
jgi:ATP:corrinoid adenosyltransferase